MFVIIDDLKHKIQIKSAFQLHLTLNDSWTPLNELLIRNNKINLCVSAGDLAVLSIDELKPLFAFQLLYAKYIECGVNGCSLRTIMRIHQLLDLITEREKIKGSDISIYSIMKPVLMYFNYHLLGRYIMYSKHNEKKVDLMVEEICGEDSYNGMILKTNIANNLNRRTYPIEHIIAINSRESYWLWLNSKLAPVDVAIVDEIKGMLLYTNISNEYSAGNVITERIRMAAVYHQETKKVVPAYSLLNNSTKIAQSLIDELILDMKKHEFSDSKNLIAQIGKMGLADLAIVQGFGIFIMILGSVALVITVISAFQVGFANFLAADGTSTIFIIMVIGVGLYLIKYRAIDNIGIPVPDYSIWVNMNRNVKLIVEFYENVDAIQNDLKTEYPSSKANVKKLLDMSLSALHDCDYERAHAASDLALQYSGRSLGALFIKLIASHPANQFESNKLLDQAYKIGKSDKLFFWVMAWAGLNLGYHEFAEKSLILALKKNPKSLALYPYLAYIRYNRMKFFSAEEDIVKGIEGGCGSAECMLLYADILRSVGKPRDAIRVLEGIDPSEVDGKDLMHRLMLVKQLAGSNDESYAFAKQLSEQYPDSETMMRIANDYISASALDEAEEFYQKAFDLSPGTASVIGLAQVEYHRYNFSSARDKLHQALGLLNDHSIEPQDAASTLNNILLWLISLDKPVDTCHVWTVDIEIVESDILLRNQQVMIFAMNTTDAERYARKILSAIYPELDKDYVKFANWVQMTKEPETRVPGVAEWRLDPAILKMEPESEP
ncbi:MAG: tetratricopeptide repeat protein [Armatimonadota bacterium]